MRHLRSIAAAFAACLALAALPATSHDHMHPGGAPEARMPLPGGSIYNLESSWTTQDGTAAKVESLRGKPVIAAMIYTSCRDMCPAIVADMLWIEKHLPPGAVGRVRFALFSFDSLVDTPERLKGYAAEHGMEASAWTLFHGDSDAVRELAAALGVRYRPDGKGGFDHASVISLIDADGTIVFQQRGTEETPKELVARLGAIAAPRL
jgi:protein SCO1/2